MTDSLLPVAESLIAIGIQNNDQAYLRRAVSTAYYALFHAFSASAADLQIGPDWQDRDAWSRVYRALNHGPAKAACVAVKNQNFSTDIVDCAESFIVLQDARNDADYNPLYLVGELEAQYAIDTARMAIGLLDKASVVQRRRFAVYLLFQKR